MRLKTQTLFFALAAWVFGGTAAFAQGTTFTYQGRLDNNGIPVSGSYDLRFTIYDAPADGSIVAGPITNAPISVSNGLFTVMPDFGAGVFNGAARWLEIGVRTNGGGTFTTLGPRQPITATPYAITAANFTGTLPGGGLAGTYSNAVIFNNPANSFSGSGAGLTSLDASQLTSGTVPEAALGNAWKLHGNVGTVPGADFFGTTDDQPLELRVNNQRAFRFTSGVFAPNVIGGSSQNSIAAGVSAATIGGGRHNSIATNADHATIAGGVQNRISTNANSATIAGGEQNTILLDADRATIGGGERNTNGASFATVPGGRDNLANGPYSLAAGRRAKANHLGAFVWADSTDADFASAAANQFAVRASGGVRLETAGTGATLDGQPILSGAVNAAQIADGAALAEILDDDGASSGLDADRLDGLNSSDFWRINGNAGTTAGAHFVGTTDNQPLELRVNGVRALRLEQLSASDEPSLIGGFVGNNIASGVRGAVIAGGGGVGVNGANSMAEDSDFSAIGGGLGNALSSSSATIAGGSRNNIAADAGWSAIGGGELNGIQSNSFRATISGGNANNIGTNASWSTIGGGEDNTINGMSHSATIAGGNANRIAINSFFSSIGGGADNLINGVSRGGTIAGGRGNTIGAGSALGVIGGGETNTIGGSAPYATIPGGRLNSVASGATGSFAAGYRAKANHAGAFVWADDTDTDFASTTNKQFAVRANNGLMIQGTNTALELRGGGALRVQGAGVSSSTPVFIHRATVANTSANITSIDHPHCNNDPNAILIVTPNWNPGGAGGTYNNHPIGVYYNGTRWTIFNQDIAAMPVNAAFNVLVFKP